MRQWKSTTDEGESIAILEELDERAERIRELEADDRWATKLCSAHRKADPLCRICNPSIAELEAALRQCVAWMPLAEVRSWPPGFRLRDEALAAAKKVLND